MMTRNLIIAAVALIVFAFLHLGIMAQTTSIGYKLDAGKNELDELRSNNRSLAAKLASETSLYKIEKIAREKLMMVRPEKIVYIHATGEERPAGLN